MSDLLLSPSVLLRFEGLKNILPRGEFLDNKLDVKVKFENIAVGMIQPDRYDATINCYIEISKYKIKFLLQDVAWALSVQANENKLTDKDPATTILQENDCAAINLVEFFVNNKMTLAAWPPAWFPAASAHASEALSRNFPELAQQVLAEHQHAWASMIDG